MKENKRIEKELLFKNNIKDITSISLDSDYKVNKKEIVGNFLITGDYKIHEVSINRENFNFKIPFKHEFDSDIDEKTIKLEITNFEYDYNKDELIVNIEYEITGDRKDVLIFDNEETLEEFLSSREIEVVDTRIDEIKQEIIKEESKKSEECKEELEDKIKPKELEQKNEEELKESLNEDRKTIEIEETKKDIVENELNTESKLELKETEPKLNIDIKPENDIIQPETEEREKIKTDEIINNVGKIDDAYVTYKVYTINSNETLESIVIKYHTTIDELKEYNDLNNLSINDKIIIPYYE